MSISFLLGAFLSILSVPFRKSILLTQLFLFYIWLLWGWNYWNGDYEAYETLYNNILFTSTIEYEIGYKMLMLLAKVNNLTFQEFFQIVSLCVIFLWDRFILKVTRNPALFVAIFFWLFFPLDYVLLRNTIAFSIILQGLLILINNKPYKAVKFSALVFIATTIHSSSYFYFLFLLLPFLAKLSNDKILLLSFLVIIIGFLSRSIFFSFTSGNFEGRESSYNGSIVLMVIYGMWEIMTSWILYRFKSKFVDTNHKDNPFDILFYMSIILLALIPIYSMVGIVVRIYRNMLMVFIAFLSNILFQRKYSESVILSMTFISVFLITQFILPVLHYTIWPLFNNNIIFN
ncbi:MAG: hypothetical protein HDR92_02630 [Bacteroides sp.]|nr:hypothetical protein [Bacteroides sp.]